MIAVTQWRVIRETGWIWIYKVIFSSYRAREHSMPINNNNKLTQASQWTSHLCEGMIWTRLDPLTFRASSLFHPRDRTFSHCTCFSLSAWVRHQTNMSACFQRQTEPWLHKYVLIQSSASCPELLPLPSTFCQLSSSCWDVAATFRNSLCHSPPHPTLSLAPSSYLSHMIDCLATLG